MENRNCYDEIVGQHQKGGAGSASWCLCTLTYISPDTFKAQTVLWPKILWRADSIKVLPFGAAAVGICVQWHGFEDQHLFEAKTNLTTNLYLRVARVLLPDFSHSWAERFHESLVLQVEEIEFLRHPFCPAWASCLSGRAIEAWMVFFKCFSIFFETLVVYLSDVCVRVNLVQRKN